MSDKKELTLRPLYGDDVFKVVNLINKLGLVESLEELLNTEKRQQIINQLTAEKDKKEDEEKVVDLKDKKKEKVKIDTTEQLGFEMLIQLVKQVFRNLPSAREEMNEFLADLTETDVETIKHLKMKEYIQLIKDFFSHPDFKELLGSVQEFIGSE
ncbi:MAG: hypothetical protein F6I01_002155 [Aerococcus sanguinicola]